MPCTGPQGRAPQPRVHLPAPPPPLGFEGSCIHGAFGVGLDSIRDAPTPAQAITAWKLCVQAQCMLPTARPAKAACLKGAAPAGKGILGRAAHGTAKAPPHRAALPPRRGTRRTTYNAARSEPRPTTCDTPNGLRDPAHRPPEPHILVEPYCRTAVRSPWSSGP